MTSHLVFTDGASSGNPGPGGWGAIVRTAAGQVREIGGGSPRTTNNAMELAAAVEALRLLEGIPGNVVVRTDSTYMIKGIEAWVHRWRVNGWKTADGNPVLNRELWQDLLKQVEARRGSGGVQWEYVPGHRGIPGNERADWIATRYAQGLTPPLYDGPAVAYDVDLDFPLPEEGRVPSASRKNSRSKSSKAGHYLSLVDGKILRHQSWTSCEARVKGRSGARFKKVSSREEEQDVLKRWGVASQRVFDAEG